MRSHSLLLLFVLGVSLTVGCGQGEYDARMDTASSKIAGNAAKAQAAVLMADFFPVTDPNRAPTRLKFKLPSLFDAKDASVMRSLGAEPRAKLQGADITGFCYTMERDLDDDGGKKVHSYCYLYVVTKATTPADQLQSAITTALGAISPTPWTDAPPINGIPVKTLQASGNTEFEETTGAATVSLPSQVKAYSFDAGVHQVVVAWRVPTAAGNKNNLLSAIDQSMKTATLDPQ